MLSSVCGYSSEQAVLGKTSRLPASIVADEDTPAHLHSVADDTGRFFNSLRRRTEARKAFLESDKTARQQAERCFADHGGKALIGKMDNLVCTGIRGKSPNMLEKGKWRGPRSSTSCSSRVTIDHLD